MQEQFARTAMLLGQAAVEKLAKSRVAVFGIGGVGGFACEALVRSGVGMLDIVDHDKVSLTNLNRQIIALHSTVGQYKTDVMASRIRDINPACKVNAHRMFFLPETEDSFAFEQYDYVIDAVDTVTAKIALVLRCGEAGTPIISSMGAGNKLNPSAFEVADIYATSVDPLARVMRRELKKRQVNALKVVYSKEKPLQDANALPSADTARKKAPPGSVAFVPSAAGLVLASEVVKDLIAMG